MNLFSGDLFEKFEDIEHPNIWIDAGSEYPDSQLKNRLKVAEIADWIVPGHGKKFQVNNNVRLSLIKQINGKSSGFVK